MKRLLQFSVLAGAPRGLLDRFLARPGIPPGLANRIVGGTGDVDSAQLAQRLWTLGRVVASDETLSTIFDNGLDGIATRTEHTPLRPAVDAFLADHGHRGNDEYELATPAWVMDPAPVYAAIDRLRHAPDDRDPVIDRPTSRHRRRRGAGRGPRVSCRAACDGSHGAARWSPGRARSAVSGPRTSSCSRTSVPASCYANWFGGPRRVVAQATSAWPSASRSPSSPTSSPPRTPSPT